MIKTAFILSICKAFPQGEISEPFENASYVFDANGSIIGHFDYGGDTFFLYREYEYFSQAKEVLRTNGTRFEVRGADPAALLYDHS